MKVEKYYDRALLISLSYFCILKVFIWKMSIIKEAFCPGIYFWPFFIVVNVVMGEGI